MNVAWVSCGLAGIAGTATLALWLTFRDFHGERPPRRNVLAERLVPVDEGDMAWLGVYRLFTDDEEFELEPNGSYRTSSIPSMNDDSDWCLTGSPWPPKEKRGRTGSWRRSDGNVVLQPDEVAPPWEFQLGVLDGDYVLLTEFCTWRRVPDVAATSSSR